MSRLAPYRGEQGEGVGWVVREGGWKGGWEARGGLKLLFGLFGLSMSLRSACHSPKHA